MEGLTASDAEDGDLTDQIVGRLFFPFYFGWSVQPYLCGF